MEARATLERRRISTTTLVTFVLAVAVAFLLGGGGGYLIRASSVPIVTPTSHVGTGQTTGSCPAGSHPVVWYTAKTSSCVQD